MTPAAGSRPLDPCSASRRGRRYIRPVVRTPAVCACGAHGWASLTAGYITIFDPTDIQLVGRNNWFCAGNNIKYAASRDTETGKVIYLHKVLLGIVSGIKGDHINRNSLDNRRKNLRVATDAQNSQNRIFKSYGRPFKGVRIKPSGSWQADIKVGRKHHYLGSFDDQVSAAKAYDEAAKKHFGEYACLNFPGAVV